MKATLYVLVAALLVVAAHAQHVLPRDVLAVQQQQQQELEQEAPALFTRAQMEQVLTVLTAAQVKAQEELKAYQARVEALAEEVKEMVKKVHEERWKVRHW
jgi:peptidoglycan hydrolase CwlO-like protein